MKRLLSFIISTTLFVGTISCMKPETVNIYRKALPSVRILKLNSETHEVVPVWQSTPESWYFGDNSKQESKPIRKIELIDAGDALMIIKSKKFEVKRTTEEYFSLRVPCCLGDFRLNLNNIAIRIDLSDITISPAVALFKGRLTGIDGFNTLHVFIGKNSGCIDLIFNEHGSFIMYDLTKIIE